MPRNGKLVRITLALAAAALVSALAAGAATAGQKRHAGAGLVGAGSTLIQPALQGVWDPAYTGGSVQYSGIGSGGGIQAISHRTVDFGASDAPLTGSQAKGCHGCFQIPWALTATGPVYNIPGVAGQRLRLTGPVLAKIYLGRLTTWSAPAIKKLNPGLSLPNLKITVVHRSDGSGDSYVFTNYLSKVSKQWASKVGFATTVNWPTGVGGHGNPGVASLVYSTPGSIGYVSTAYVIQNHLHMAKVRNASGKFVIPTVRTIEAAAQLTPKKLPQNNRISLVDPPKSEKYKNAWPLSTFTYVIVPNVSPKAAALKAFISWVLQPAQQKAVKRLVFAQMPSNVVKKDRKTLNRIHP